MNAAESLTPPAETLPIEAHRPPAWLLDRCAQAAAEFAQRGYPDPRHEEWKYTKLRTLKNQSFVTASHAPMLDAADLERCTWPDLPSHRLVFVDGIYQPALSEPGDLPAGVQITSLAQAIAAGAVGLEAVLGTLVDAQYSSFAACNLAQLFDGALIQLAPDTSLQQPVHLLFIHSAQPTPQIYHPHSVIQAGQGSKAHILEHHLGLPGAQGFCNSATEIHIGANATVEHTLLQEHSEASYHIGNLFIRAQRDSRLISHNINLGGRLTRHDLNVDLCEPGAEAVLNGLFVVSGTQHTDTHTRIHHRAPHTRSEETYRGIADDQGRGVFKGRVLVARDAQKIEAHQHNANLLLSDKAEIDTKPELEIYADDVRCSHGATIGQLDPQSLYYLQSRGINRETARDMLIFAFADEVIQRLPLAPLATHIEHALQTRLPEGAGVN